MRAPHLSASPLRALSARAALSALSLLDSKPQWAVCSDEIEVRQRIGSGTFGIVYSGCWRRQRVAIKMLRVDHSRAPSEHGSRRNSRIYSFLSEMQLMADLNHPNVVRFLAGCLEQGHVSMVHELCVCSLHELLHTAAIVHGSLQLPLAVQLRWAREMALGVAYLHSQTPPVVHRDLKPGNVLLGDGWVAKISDFGAARLREQVVIETTRMGTSQWTAPEVLRQQPHDERSDAYSFGILLYELASRKMPYSGLSLQQVEVGIITGQQPKPDVAGALRSLEPRPPASVMESITSLAQVRAHACPAGVRRALCSLCNGRLQCGSSTEA
jgi:serine/threonine protein kinase